MKKLFGKEKPKTKEVVQKDAPAQISTPIYQQHASQSSVGDSPDDKWEVISGDASHSRSGTPSPYPPNSQPPPHLTTQRAASPFSQPRTTPSQPQAQGQTQAQKRAAPVAILSALDPNSTEDIGAGAGTGGGVPPQPKDRKQQAHDRHGPGVVPFWSRDKDRERDHHVESGDDLARMIVHLAESNSEDWPLVLELCDRASASESNAKEAARALRKELKYGEPAAQLSAARLWAIMLRNSKSPFISQSTSRKFLDTIEDVVMNVKTSPVVRERVLDVLSAATYASGSKKETGFRGLWRKVKPDGQPDDGVPLDDNDAMFTPTGNPRISQRPASQISMLPDATITQRKPPFNTVNSASIVTPFPPPNSIPLPYTPLGSPNVPQPPTQPGQQLMPKLVKPKPKKHKTSVQSHIIPPEEDVRRLFQECKIGQGNASLLSQALMMAKPEDLEKRGVIKEFYAKCRASQELICAQIDWATAGAAHSRVNRERNILNGGIDQHALDGLLDPDDKSDETVEEKLLGALLLANQELIDALKQHDDLERVLEERRLQRMAQEISKRDIRGQNGLHTPSPPPPKLAGSRSSSPASRMFLSEQQQYSLRHPPDSPTRLSIPQPVGPRPARTPSPASIAGTGDRGSYYERERTTSIPSLSEHGGGVGGGGYDLSQERMKLFNLQRQRTTSLSTRSTDTTPAGEELDEDIQTPIKPSAKALGKRRAMRESELEPLPNGVPLTEDEDDEYYEALAASRQQQNHTKYDSDEEDQSEYNYYDVHSISGRHRHQPTPQYVYDAAAERTKERLRHLGAAS